MQVEMLIFVRILLFCVFFVLTHSLTFDEDDGPQVKTPMGVIQGTFKKSYRNRTFAAFEGIPYAQPPVGNLRFMEPQPFVESWNNTFFATKNYECLQFIPFTGVLGLRGEEDCLYMYVYVPREQINPNELLDVIVHIHGGGFMIGSPKLFAGPEFLMDRDVVFVSFNYRVGILGFLSTEDEVVPGNNGLKDQSMALRWIKKNIKHFGGNPASITITGTSAGAVSVHFHYFSRMSRGLFHRGFSQSGTALNCWALAEHPLEKAQAVAKNVSCPIYPIKRMIECLRTVEARDLVNGIKSLFIYMNSIPFMPFTPVVEKRSKDAFLDDNPYWMLKRGDVYDVPWITSNTKDEGLFPVGIIAAMNRFQDFEDGWYQLMPHMLDIYYTVDKELHNETLKKIKEYYFGSNPLSQNNTFSFVKLMTDRMFTVDNEKAIRMQSKAINSELYLYLISYVVDLPHFPPGMPKGAVHADDSRLWLKVILTPKQLTQRDEKMMTFFIDFVTTYAKKGIPEFGSVTWLPVQPNSKSLNYLQISGPDAISMQEIDQLGPHEFWDSLPIREGENDLQSSSVRIYGRCLISVLIAFTVWMT
ncbi:venom carboxylesterase-6-like [Anthonomus grandis grandis]|uniref:venom carboxylesterase-6-like n=1 Tax=Anthonomus grandis grandis TaxID=2921223 RepID=UPI0021664AFD|nr:venom carboxylesterase-6-like [Anthonomus grandis grandis]XP_050295674.1 venom carboxylesterase-6-like [Anthonomus grandis grandis]